MLGSPLRHKETKSSCPCRLPLKWLLPALNQKPVVQGGGQVGHSEPDRPPNLAIGQKALGHPRFDGALGDAEMLGDLGLGQQAKLCREVVWWPSLPMLVHVSKERDFATPLSVRA